MSEYVYIEDEHGKSEFYLRDALPWDIPADADVRRQDGDYIFSFGSIIISIPFNNIIGIKGVSKE